MLKHSPSSGFEGPLVPPSTSEAVSHAVQEANHSSEIVELSRWVAQHLNHRFVVDDRKRSVPLDQLHLLIDPLTTRIQSGLLPPRESNVLTFICGVTNGGLPLDLFIKNPCLDLSLSDSTAIAHGRWLPPHLKEKATRLPDNEDGSPEFNNQHYRIISAIQKALREVNPEIPVFFLGSSASLTARYPNDIDIGTSADLRSQYSNPSDEIYKNDFDKLGFVIRKHMREGKPIIARPDHIGAVWEYMPLALGVSVARHGRALRVTPSEVFIIEAKK